MDSVLIVDADTAYRRHIAGLVREAFPGALIREASDLAAAKDALDGGFALLLADVVLPGGSGINLALHCQQYGMATCCIMMSAVDDDEFFFRAIRVGVEGYLIKDCPADQFVAKLRGLPRGEPPLSPALLRRLLSHFCADRRSLCWSTACAHGEVPLTPRERETLKLMARGYHRKDIAKAMGISINTVSDHIKSMYRKLNASSCVEAVLQALQLGLIEPDELAGAGHGPNVGALHITAR